MGATKRTAEKLIQSYNEISNTTFMAVRFGNVLGSSGSAIPTFQKQINDGGPITITHPEMTRYFMSIQEASQLILQCGALGNDGEIFLLEMGKPIRIVQMAKDLIRLSGLEPEIDIPIVFIGLRPGEKLYEELQMLNEKKVSTSHRKIMVLKDKQSHIPWSIFKTSILKLIDSAENLESEKIQLVLKQILPTYTPLNFNDSMQNESNLTRVPIKAEA
jgi:Predicted nucleoside-diphosphate sugar epimerases